MYRKYLTLVLLFMASGSMIGVSIQFYNEYQYVFAQTNQSPEADDQDVSVDANDNIKITLKGNDDDKDDEIEFKIISDPSHGELNNFDKSDGTVNYTPEKDYSGEDKFAFKVIDNKGAESDKAETKINIKPLERPNEELDGKMNKKSQNQTESSSESNENISTNQSPIAHDQELSTDANSDLDIILIGEDTDNDPIQFEIVSSPAGATLNNFDNAKGTVTYSPEMNYTGNDSFSFKVVDDKNEESNVATVSIEVKDATGSIISKESTILANESAVVANESSNNAPIAFSQNTSVSANNHLNITLIGEDTDNDPIQFEIVSNPSDATLDKFDNVKGTVTYSPKTNYTGNDSFSFKVVDEKGGDSNNAIVSVHVTENNQTNQAPQAFDQVINEANLSNYRYAIWSAGEEEDRYILFSRSTDGGKTFSTPLSLSGKSRTSVFNPEVSSQGNIVYVVWQGQSENGNQDIFMRKSEDYGSSFSGVENLSNDLGGSGNPQVSINGNTTHVAWEGTTPGNNYIFYSKSDNGAKFDSPQKIGDNKGIPYSPELIVKNNPVTDSFTFKAVDDNGAESNVATVEVNSETVNHNTLNDETKSISVDSNQEMDITLKAKGLNNDPVQFEIVTAPTQGHLDKFDPNSGKVTYVTDEDNKIDIQWHDYQNGQDRILSKVVDNGEEEKKDDNSGQKQSNDPFKSKQ